MVRGTGAGCGSGTLDRGRVVTPEYLNELADMVDPRHLWRLSPFVQMKLPEDLRKQLDAGIALRRYASHIHELNRALEQGKSRLITPMSRDGMSQAKMWMAVPAKHKKFLERRNGS